MGLRGRAVNLNGVFISIGTTLDGVVIGHTPISYGSRIYPITFTYSIDVKQVVVNDPTGIVSIPSNDQFGKIFNGYIDLSDICLDGQTICIIVSAMTSADLSAKPLIISSSVIVPNENDDPMNNPVKVTVGEIIDGKAVATIKFGSPVKNVAVAISDTANTNNPNTRIYLSVSDAIPWGGPGPASSLWAVNICHT